MSRRFNNKDNPISARRKLQFIKQYEHESLQEFAQRFYFITINGYDESGRKAVDHISTENFIMGCKKLLGRLWKKILKTSMRL